MKFEDYEISKSFYKLHEIKTDTIETDKKEWGMDDEMDIEDLKERVIEYLNTNHPLYFREIYLKDGKWIKKNEYDAHKRLYNEKMKKLENIYKKLVLDNSMNRRIRRMKKEKKEIDFELDFVESAELIAKMDEAKSYLDTIDRKVVRKFDTKTQIDYFNESFQEKSEKVDINDPLSEFFQNQIRNVKDKVEDFERNNRITRNEEWMNYENQREQIANEMNYENVSMESFHESFEKNRSKIPQDEDILNGNLKHPFIKMNEHMSCEMQSTSSRTRPMTLEELLKERDNQI